MTTPAHPQRCETCNHYLDNDSDDPASCNVREEWISEDIWRWIRIVGCASHSSVQSRDQVLSQSEKDSERHRVMLEINDFLIDFGFIHWKDFWEDWKLRTQKQEAQR